MYQQYPANSTWGQSAGQGTVKMSDQDFAYFVLTELKRTAREYTTACTEAVCKNLRQMYQNLLQSTLQQQAQLFDAMQQQNQYAKPSNAPAQEIQSELQNHAQAGQKLQAFVQQYLGFPQQAQFSQQAGAQQFQGGGASQQAQFTPVQAYSASPDQSQAYGMQQSYGGGSGYGSGQSYGGSEYASAGGQVSGAIGSSYGMTYGGSASHQTGATSASHNSTGSRQWSAGHTGSSSYTQAKSTGGSASSSANQPASSSGSSKQETSKYMM